jgi:hypothetical protein
MDYTESYRKHLKTFSLLTRDAFELSIYLSSVFGSNTEEFSNENFGFLSIFTKIALHANSILTLLPKDAPKELYGTEHFRVIDLSSIASLTRDIIDADNTLFYLFTERVDDSEREFRLLLFGLHGHMRQRELVNLIGGSHHSISAKIDVLRNQLKANSFFTILERDMAENTQRGKRAKDIFKRTGGEIENIKDSVFLTRKQITEVRGMDLSSFDAIYMLLSSHVHSFLMGTSFVGSAIISSEESLLMLFLTLKNASFYLCLAMIDTTILFPETAEKLSPKSRKILQSIMRGEAYDF